VIFTNTFELSKRSQWPSGQHFKFKNGHVATKRIF